MEMQRKNKKRVSERAMRKMLKPAKRQFREVIGVEPNVVYVPASIPTTVREGQRICGIRVTRKAIDP